MPKRLLRKLSFILAAAVFFTGCPLRVSAADMTRPEQGAGNVAEAVFTAAEDTSENATSAASSGTAYPSAASDTAHIPVDKVSDTAHTSSAAASDAPYISSDSDRDIEFSVGAGSGADDASPAGAAAVYAVTDAGDGSAADNAAGYSDTATVSESQYISADTAAQSADTAAQSADTATPSAASQATPGETVELICEAGDGITVSVTAPAGTFPDGAVLSVRKVAADDAEIHDIDAAVDNAKLAAGGTSADKDDASSGTETGRFAFDIKVLDADGSELQPAGEVQISFMLKDSDKPVTSAGIYHLEEAGGAEVEQASGSKAADSENSGTVGTGSVADDGTVDTDGTVTISDSETAAASGTDTEDDSECAYIEDGELINDLEQEPAYDETGIMSDGGPASSDGGPASSDDASASSDGGPASSADASASSDGGHASSDGDSWQGPADTAFCAKYLETRVDEDALLTVSASTSGFSYYVVEFFYGTYRYVLEGDGETKLQYILEALQLDINPADITDVETSDETLFTATLSEGEWYVKSLEPFSTREWMKIHAGDTVYEIAVTDAKPTEISTETQLLDALTADGNYILMNDIDLAGSDIITTKTKNVVIDLNGKAISTDYRVLNITANSKFTVNDSSGQGRFGMTVNVNKSTITINAGTFTNSINVSSSCEAYITGGIFSESISNIGELVITGGYFATKISNGMSYGFMEIPGTVEICSGIFKELPYNVAGTVNITGGYFSKNPTSLLSTQYKAVYDKESSMYEVVLNTQVVVVRNSCTGTEYNDLQTAIDEASDDDTLTLVNNIVYENDNGPTINSKDITLDFDGYTFTGWLGVGCDGDGSGGDVSIIGSSENSPIIFEVANGGSLTFESGNFMSNSYLSVQTEWSFITVGEGCVVNINGGSYRGRICNNGGTLNLNSGTRVYGQVYNYGNYSETSIIGATLELGSFDSIVRSDGIDSELHIDGGDLLGAVSLSRGSMDFRGGTYSGTITQYDGTNLDISGGVFGSSSTLYAFAKNADANITMELSGGRYYCSGNAYTDTFPYTKYIKEGYEVVADDINWWAIYPKSVSNEAELYVNGTRTERGLLSRMLSLANDSSCVVKIIAADGVSHPETEYTVHDRATLDLNGKELEALGIEASDGYLIDSASTDSAALTDMGSVIINGGVFSLKDTNAYMPLYDSAAGAYRMFTYGAATTMGQKKESGSETYSYLRVQYELTFGNSNAYDLLAGGKSGLSVSGSIRWRDAETGSDESKFEIGFTGGDPEYVVKYGTDKPSSPNTVFYIHISGIDSWKADKKLQTYPIYKVSGVTGQFNPGTSDFTRAARVYAGGRAVYSTYS